MIAYPFRYESPSTLSDALALLREPGAKALAGGMSLVPMMKLRLAVPETLVDLRCVPDQNQIEPANGHLRIGFMTTHSQIKSDNLVRASCPLLAECAGRIGDVQVRNVGTIGGSVAHADPAADYPAALLALDAQILIAGKEGERTIAADEFFVDTFTTVLAPDELITRIVVPRGPSTLGAAYEKKVQPASGFAIVGVAARIQLENGRVSSARVGVTGLTGKPYRARNVEQRLEGSSGSAADIEQAASVIADDVDPNSDLHASADYRAHLGRIFAIRAITRARQRAGAAA